jgi:glycosyltransferase involved in cell wall biosynthesis
MKILLLTPNYAPERGACAERVRHLAEFLQAQGHEILVIAPLPNYPTGKIFSDYQHTFHKKEVINNVPILRYWVYASHSKNLWYRFLSVFSLAISVLFMLPSVLKFSPKIIYVQSPPLFLGFSGLLFAKLTQAKYWLNISDLWSNVLLDLEVFSNKKNFIYQIINQLEIFLYKQATIISGQSEEIITEISLYNSQVLLYRTGVDTNLFKPHYQNIIPQNTNSFQPIRIVYAGLLGIAQGVLAFCQQVELPSHISFHIYGEGAEKEEIATYLAKNAKKNIFLHPSLSQQDLANILPTFDIALILQRKTIRGTVPSKLYEALACGLQIWYIGGGEGAEIVEKHQLGQVFQDYANCNIALQNLTTTNLKSNKEKSAQIALQNFDKNTIVSNFYQKLLMTAEG